MGKKSANPNVLSILSENFSIRKGKFGPYIFYKMPYMNKPRFLNLKGRKWREMQKQELIDWCKEEYNI
tara:strand:+ start:3263 stop:3466 length:204 start_codon:yes stop_codon:yes gene_type:complete